MILILGCFVTTYVASLPVIPVFAVVLTLGIFASYVVERAKGSRR